MTTSAKEWLGKRLRYLTTRRRYDGVSQLPLETQVTFLPMDAIGEQGQLDLSRTRPIDEVQSGYSRLADGDVVVAKITPCFENGKGGVIEGTRHGIGFGTTELHVLTPSAEIDARYLYYITVDQKFRSFGTSMMTGAAGQQRVPEDFVRNYEVKLPSLGRQRAIAEYLDHEIGLLDSTVETKRQAVQLLSEKENSLISSAVSFGLNTDVTLRESSIPWIGHLPSHWDVWKLGHVAAVGNGSTPSRANPAYWMNGAIPWLNSSVVNQHEVKKADQFVTDLAVRERHLPLVKSGSVLVAITGQGKTRGQAAVLSLDATVSQHLVYVSPDPSRLAPWFLKWTFLAAYDFLRRISDDTGGTKGALTCEDIHNLRVPVPPIKEQLQIVDHIRHQASKLLELREGLEKTLSLLQERRASLIAEAVTGQLVME